MKKIIVGLVTLILASIATYAYGSQVVTLITETGKYEKVTIASGEATVFGFSRKIENIEFSKDSGFTIRTLEGGIWKDLSDNITDYSPITGILARNISEGDLIITATYAEITAIENTIFQKSLKAGWNLISPAYKDDYKGTINTNKALGESLPYSQVLDFTGNGFIYSGENIISTPNHNLNDLTYKIKEKSELENVSLIEKLAYGLFINVDSVISGSQKLTDSEFIVIEECDEVMQALGLCEEVIETPVCDEVSQALGLCETEIPVETQCDEVMFALGLCATETPICDEISEILGLCATETPVETQCNEVMQLLGACGQTHVENQCDEVLQSLGLCEINETPICDEVSELLGLCTIETPICDEVSELLGLCTNYTGNEIACSSDTVFSDYSCNRCFDGGKKNEGNALALFSNTWNNVTDLKQIAYIDEQINPEMVNLGFGNVIWVQNPDELNFWEYTSEFNNLYNIGEDGYILNDLSSINWIQSKLGYSYSLDKNDINFGENIGLLTHTLKTHTIDDNNNISIDSNIHKDCTLYKSADEQNPTPTNLQATNIGTGSIDLTWNTAENAVMYYVKYGIESGNYINNTDLTDLTSLTIDGLNNNTTYYLSVVAFDANGNESTPSEEIQATTNAEISEKGWLYLSLSDNIIINKDYDINTIDEDININGNQGKDVAEINFHGIIEDVKVNEIKVTYNNEISSFNPISNPQINIYLGEGKTPENYLGSPTSTTASGLEVTYRYDDLLIEKDLIYKIYVTNYFDGIISEGNRLNSIDISSASGVTTGENIIVDMTDVGLNNRIRDFNLYPKGELTVTSDETNVDNLEHKTILAGEEAIIYSVDVLAENEEVNAQTVSFTLNTDLKTVIKSAKLYLNDTIVATASNSDVTTDSIITFDNISNLNFPTTTSELKLAITTENIGFEKVGTAISNASVSSILISDAQGINSSEIVNVLDSTIFGSNTFDVTPTVVSFAITDELGVNDSDGTILFSVDSGLNTDQFGNTLEPHLTTIKVDSFILGATGSLTLKNGNFDLISTTNVDINGDIFLEGIDTEVISHGEAYTFETFAEAILKLQEGISYEVDGNIYKSLYSTNLILGNYQNQ